jgi:2-desacetyl-2-hydroxyethyl bacteriochlorophyllide A dehydrogenase
MQAVILDKPGQFSVVEVGDPQALRPEEALVRIRRVGVCGTDQHAYRGRQPFFSYPRILGHELGAEVLEIGPNDRGIKAGDRCAIEPYMNCGHCVACRRGKTNCCSQLRVLGVHVDGGLQERLVVPERKLHKSEKLSFEELALVETLGIGAHAVGRAQLQADDTVAIIGLGPIGLSVLQFASGSTNRIVGVDLAETRLAFAKQTRPGMIAIEGGARVAEQLRDALSGELPTVVFDCTGSPKSMMEAFHYVAHSGKLIFVGLVSGQISFDDPQLHSRELTVMASRNSTALDIENVIRVLEAGEVSASSWVTHRAMASSVPDVFPRWMEPSINLIKGVFEI